jgi:hypothetical protein
MAIWIQRDPLLSLGRESTGLLVDCVVKTDASDAQMRSGGDRRHRCLTAVKLGEDVECSDIVLPCGGEIGAYGGERSGTVVTLEATADLLGDG